MSYHIGSRPLLREIDWQVSPGERVALIGPNGAGKTTLLRILTGELQAESGSIIMPRGYQTGYLPQEEVSLPDATILDSVMAGHRQILEIEQKMAAIHTRLEKDDHQQEHLLERLGELEARFQLLGGYQLEAQAKSILSGLGFGSGDFTRRLAEFSGGWRMRVYLARLLLQAPDLLLLDEPTNHLDNESLEWLEQYLGGFPGSIITVSHDRFFIDRVAGKIAELDRGSLVLYEGNYHYYEMEKRARLELLQKKWEEQKAERERIKQFIDRFRYKAAKAAQVQSRIKMLEKMPEIELPPPPRRIHFRLRVDQAGYKNTLAIKNLSFRYDQPWVLRNINLNIYRGEKVALVGVNGAGKTTLTRLIAGQLRPVEGSVQIGERTHIGYYAQHQVDALHLDATILGEVAETAAESFRTQLRDILGIFQFSGADVEKRIRVLSGGEKARVSLARMLLSPANFLIMDEPTNHLDIASREALEDALKEYDGTLLLISHDRYFLDKLVTRVIELKGGHLRLYEGNYSDYLRRRLPEPAEISAPQPAAVPDNEAEKTAATGRKTREQKRREAEERQAVSRRRKQFKDEIRQLEAQIQLHEKRKAEVEAELARPQTYRNGGQAEALKKEYAQVQQQLQSDLQRWEECQLSLEALLAALDRGMEEG